MDDFLAHLLEGMLRLIGLSADGLSNRVQGVLVLTVCAIVSLIGGLWFSGIASVVFFVVCGLSVIGGVLVGFGVLWE
ncbi:MAG: hypothetical protein FD138_2837 [Planctomycetota bacterium]|nr:MAG: hypothetical protein FD138_2837 [Planctomycetota bacterium]